MYNSPWLGNISRSDALPPTHVTKKVKDSEKWQKAMCDSFESIAIQQFRENLKFWDYYRMVDGKMSYQELKEAVPFLENVQQLLDGVGIPSFLKHYDILGVIINQLVGKLIELQDKFHVVDTGEVAENEYLRHRNEQIQKIIVEAIDNEVKLHLAEVGLREDGQQFSSQEEQQQYMAVLAAEKEKLTPKDSKQASTQTYKSIGVEWGEATLDKDNESFDMIQHKKQEFTDKLLTGRCFREYKIGYDSYYPVTWSPKATFHSKESSAKYSQNGEYIGRILFPTPAEVIKTYGHYMSPKVQRELLGGNETWQNFIGDGVISGTIQESIESNFGKVMEQPFANYLDYNFYLGLQDSTGEPMGQMTMFNKDGTETVVDRFLPKIRNRNAGAHNYYAQVLRDDFEHRTDLCQVVEGYFRAYDLWGYLTYEDPETGRIITEEVTEEILPQFLKENNIKQTFKESLSDIIDSFEVDTLKWTYRPVTYEYVKIQSGNLSEPLYLYCRPCKHQIKGDSDFDVLLPVAGIIGKPIAPKIMPFQSAHNLVMNQIYNLLEKEIGIFFLLDVSLIPSDIEGWGDAQEAMISMRNLAKDIGIMPVQTSGDAQKNNNNFNQFSTYNLSNAPMIANRVQLADFFKMKAYEVIGTNPQMFMQPEKYVTATGVQVSNEASFAQIAEIYEDFSTYDRKALELHLSVAQYCQSNKKDLSITYTKSDASLQFLKISDPEFPLRRIGLLPSKDSKKRKELESFKQYLMSSSTLQSDTLEVARLMSSDAMSEALEIAKRERDKRLELEQQAHERQKELLTQQGEQAEAQSVRNFDRDMLIEREKSRAKIVAAELTATGRAADSQGDQNSFDQIEEAANRGLRETSEQNKLDMHSQTLESKEKTNDENLKLKWAQLAQKTKELEAKMKISENEKFSSIINKN